MEPTGVGSHKESGEEQREELEEFLNSVKSCRSSSLISGHTDSAQQNS